MRPNLLIVAVATCAIGSISQASIAGDELQVSLAGSGSPTEVSTSSKDFLVALTSSSRDAPPGSTITLRYVVLSNEETDERIRLRVEAGPGWTVLDSELPEREWLIEAYDEVQGELHLALPEDAAVGGRQLVRLLVEVIGEPGVLQAQQYVTVVKRARGKPGAPVVSGTSTLGVSHLGSSGFADAQSAGGLQLATTFGPQSSLSFSYDRGLLDNLTNYRYSEEPTQISGSLRHAGWEVSFGNRVPSFGNAVAGPFVQGLGASIRRPRGRLLAELLIAQPVQFGGGGGGHLVRGRAGLQSKKGLIAVAVSDFGRPDGGYTTLPTVQQLPLDADEAERIEIERAVTARAPSNRVQGLGVESEFQPVRAHRLTVRTGALRLANARGDQSTAAVGEASYSFSSPQIATFSARWRQMPPTLPGIFISGDELATDGNIRIVGPLRVVGRAFRNSSETLGREFQMHGEGTSVGMRYQRSAYRLEARWNYRESQFTSTNIRRTVSVNGAIPFGPLVFSANADTGTQDNGKTVGRVAFYRADLRWTGQAGTMSFDVTHSKNGVMELQRIDFTGTLNVAHWELGGGVWGTRGYTAGGEPGMWAAIGVPVGSDLLIRVGVDRAPIDWLSTPTWRGTLAVRKRFSLPLPFGGRTTTLASVTERQELADEQTGLVTAARPPKSR